MKGKHKQGGLLLWGKEHKGGLKQTTFLPNGSPDFDKMIMKPPCQEAYKKYNGNGRV
jgi:hypothetical protein